MRTTVCTLVFLFSLPWSLNSHLTTSNKNTAINIAYKTVRQRDYTTDSGTENVVSLSKGTQTRQFRLHSEQKEISLRKGNGKDDSSRIRRNVEHPTTQMQEKVTQQKELQTPTNSSHRPHITSALQTENSTELNAFSKPSNATYTDVAPEKKIDSGLSETPKATQETPSISDVQSNTTVKDGNESDINNDLPTTQPTTEISYEASPVTHAHTSTKAIVTNGTLSTNDVKTTEAKEVTDRWTNTQRPEIRTSSTTKTIKILMTTRKTTKTQSPPLNNKKANPGPAVAAVIGTTFVLMFIAIIFILFKKRKMQRKQLENPEWAGPSPFLEVDVQPNLPNMDESEAINRQGSNRSAFSRYLSQRLSKHMTFGRNTSEEVLMGDILQGSTFGRQNPDEVQAPNGNPTVAQGSAETGDNKIEEGQESLAKAPVSGSEQETVTKSKESKLNDDLTAAMSSGLNIVKPPPLVSIDLDSLSEEGATLQASDAGIIPPAPPLP